MTNHRRQQETNNFCANAAKGGCKCPKKNCYIANCKGQAAGWGKYSQSRSKRDKVTKKIKSIGKNERSFEAHHVLPVACVRDVILKWDSENNSDPSVISGTKWCINAKTNMIALPMWGHTIVHYCKNFEDVEQEIRDEARDTADASVGGKRLRPLSVDSVKELASTGTRNTVPKFKNLPQHNYGHTGKTADSSYNLEISKMLADALTDVGLAQNKHKTDDIDDLKKVLDGVSKVMEAEIRSRGTRSYGGTHEAWKEAMKGAKDWYKSFALSETPTPMSGPFGSTRKGLAQKIAAIAQAAWL